MRIRKFLAPLLALPLLALSLHAQAAQRYISDQLFVYIHSGPSNQYRIIGSANAGERIDVLERNADSGYVKVKTQRGKTGWIVGKNISDKPVARTLLPQVQNELADAKEQLKSASEREQALQQQLEQLEQQRQQQVSLLEQEKEQIESQFDSLDSQRSKLQNQIDQMDESLMMQWFMKGSIVMAIGIVFGLIIPLFFRRRRTSNNGWA